MNNKMNELKEPDVSILECHPVIWWLHTFLYMAMAVLAIYVVCAMKPVPPKPIIVMAIFVFMLSFYGLISFPRKITIDSSYLILTWLWFRWRIPTEKINKIRVKPYRIKVVFITIIRKKAFFNMPIMFDWNLQSKDYKKVLADIVKRFEKENGG